MGVNNRLNITKFIFIIGVIFSQGCTAAQPIEEVSSLELISRKIMRATTDYSLKIEHCNSKIAKNKIPLFDKRWANSSESVRQEAVTAIGFLQSHNYFICEKEERLELAFYLQAMHNLKKELGIKLDSETTINSIISYPSQSDLELEISYNKLPQKTREYFESTIGESLFDLIPALEVNGLLRY